MTPDRFTIAPVHRQLIKATQAWALRGAFDPTAARDLRRQIILQNHAHYLETLPAYRRVADEEGIGPDADVETIKRHLLLPDDIFKSYDQRWLDEADFGKMNAWLSEIMHRPVDVASDGLDSIDAWLARLEAGGIKVVYSSGTSGNFSFVPRDAAAWRLFRAASTCYLAPLLLYEKISSPWQRLAIRPAVRWLSPETFVRASGGMGLRDFDAVFLDFSSGRTGNQALEQELAPLFRRTCFLYQTGLSSSLLRLAARGPRNETERALLARLQTEALSNKAENHRRVIEALRRAAADRQKTFIFGTPYQFKELCATINDLGQPVSLRPGSLALFGGGWKSFTGERIPRDELVAQMSQSFGLAPERILEGYSMTEISTFMLRCDHGRFHIPPLIEPVILDAAWQPLAGSDVRGVFGFLDTLAISHPGFLVSGDEVRLVDGDCPCGLTGPAVLEIGRARAREVKGCGGIMASVAA
jgi:hypothetical protein